MKIVFFLICFAFVWGKSLCYAQNTFSLNAPKSVKKPYAKKNEPYTQLADFSSWNIPFSVLGPDANPLNALPSALGGQSRVGSGNLAPIFNHTF
ncbi:hypothetical protein P618_201060 [Holospora obtusa F1]|uniref:Uncharacterized protein n=1 Tax=Holospora obtusa F1 TaxID=1399147 RepID=W6TDU5_HOLOB|nr:hypothetical protein [Holospora obtusa]ETZ06769.1 hypothetical protein P618_201060 [Holospora obtusa F1]